MQKTIPFSRLNVKRGFAIKASILQNLNVMIRWTCLIENNML